MQPPTAAAMSESAEERIEFLKTLVRKMSSSNAFERVLLLKGSELDLFRLAH